MDHFPISIVFRSSLLATRARALSRGLMLSSLIGVYAFTASGARADTDFANTLSGNYLAALVAGMSNDPTSASRFYSESIKFDPRSADLAERALETLLAEGKMTEALPLANTVAKRNSGSGIARLAQGVRAIKDKNFQTARNIFRRGDRNQSSDITANLLNAWTYQGSGNIKRAFEAVDRIGDEPGAKVFRLLHRGLIAKVGGKADEARKALKAAYEADPQTLRTADLYAQFLISQKETDEALSVYRQLKRLYPRHPLVRAAIANLEQGKAVEDEIRDESDGIAEVLYGLGSAVTRDGEELASLIYLRLAHYLSPNHNLAALAIADTYERLKQPQSAITAYALIEQTSPLRLTADVQRALNLEQLDEKNQAVAVLKSVSLNHKDEIEPLIALGNVYRARKAFKDAAETYSAAIAALGQPTPGHWSLFYSRGIALERLKRWPEAEADFRKALELSPDQPLVLNYLGYSWVEQNTNLDEAFKMLRRAVEQQPTDGYIVDSLGWAYYRLGQYDKALQLMEKAVDLKAADPTINDHLGDVYWRLGREREARFQWNHARDLNPEPEDLPKILEKIEKGLPPLTSGSGG
ncbi:MAG: tetratricopeptide repeat protein [Alphaproteobacteria bacterium]|nr:tetratricopeptide repeat protein [Alphaproteobacteria bacterium]